MEVYIEDIILDNLIIDFLILYITAKILRINYKVVFLIISAFVGVAFTILNQFILLTGFVLLLYKFLLGFIMCEIAFREKSIKRKILNYLTFLLITFLIGGGCFLLCFTFGTVVLGESGAVSYNLALPLGVIVGVIALISFVLFQVFYVLKQRAETSNFVFDACVFHDNRQLKIKAFLDTGNTLFDPTTNKPVIIISYKYFKKLNRDAQLYEILLNRTPKGIKNAHYINVNSVGNSSKMLIFTMDAVKITKNKFTYNIDNAVFGLTFTEIEKKLDCAMLISQELLNGGYYE